MRTLRNIVVAPGPVASAVVGCDDVRCGCGSLLARVVGGQVELKCRRCKQVWRVALSGAGDAELGPKISHPRRREEAR